MGAEHKKGKIFNFRFWRCQGLRDEVRAIKFLMEVQATISRTDLTKFADIRLNYFVVVL